MDLWYSKQVPLGRDTEGGEPSEESVSPFRWKDLADAEHRPERYAGEVRLEDI
jgi:hypothetical protein